MNAVKVKVADRRTRRARPIDRNWLPDELVGILAGRDQTTATIDLYRFGIGYPAIHPDGKAVTLLVDPSRVIDGGKAASVTTGVV